MRNPVYKTTDLPTLRAKAARRRVSYNPFMTEPGKHPQKEPTFVEGLIGSVLPLAAAVAVAFIAGVLVYAFWFGAGSIIGWLF